MQTGKLVLLTAAACIVAFAGAVPVAGHHEPTSSDGRIVEPYGVTVLGWVPVAAGYEPVPTPMHCGEATAVTSVFYSEDFEAAHGYSSVGTSLLPGSPNLWQVTDFAGTGSDADHSADNRLYYGNVTTGNYNENHTAGTAQSPLIELPETGSVYLSFSTKWQTEWLKGYDHMWVEANDTTTGRIHILCTANAYDRADPTGVNGQTAVDSCSPFHFTICLGTISWEKRFIELPESLLGKEIRLRFTFDTADDKANPYMGWMVDDVELATGLAE